jgi:hypothetical protein
MGCKKGGREGGRKRIGREGITIYLIYINIYIYVYIYVYINANFPGRPSDEAGIQAG